MSRSISRGFKGAGKLAPGVAGCQGDLQKRSEWFLHAAFIATSAYYFLATAKSATVAG